MKKYLLLFAAIVMIACTEKNSPTDVSQTSNSGNTNTTEYWVKATPTQTGFLTNYARSTTVTVTSNTQWWVEVHQGNMQGLSVSPTSGSNRGTLTLSVPKLNNETFAAQYAHLIIWCQDGKGGRNFVRVDITRKDGSNASGTW